ncbi:MAG: metallophosphoesterase [Bacteroidales bacterium]|nr:metallophosphoesterase [Bacteroidales bacterium]
MRMPMILIPILLLVSLVYTSWRFWLILPLSPLGKSVTVAFYLLCFALVFVHYGVGNRLPMGLAAASYEIGTSWMIFFLYALLLFLALDLGRWLHLVPGALLRDSRSGTGLVLGLLTLLLVYGNVHYRHKYREVIDIQTEKPLPRPLVAVLASDLHAGYHNREKEVNRWVDLINAEEPDLVLFAGDVVDGALRPMREGRFAEAFHRLRAPAYTTLGNHEYLAGREGAEEFLRTAGLQILRDTAVTACGIRIVGRDDRSNTRRAALSALAPEDPLQFTLLLDHQPYHLEEAEQAGIDFQFSGHTHHGQVWPGNWITDLMYEKAFGAHQRGSTRYYISSGLGIWGGKFRIGTRSEYIVLRIHN